jgi:hypothetical protein
MEERCTSLFQPDTLLTEQYLDTFRRKLHLEPEKKLMLAVLEDAIACFQKYVFARDGKGKMLFQEAEDWVQEANSDWLFSFANVCETLGFNPDYLRQGLVHWKLKSSIVGQGQSLSARAEGWKAEERTTRNWKSQAPVAQSCKSVIQAKSVYKKAVEDFSPPPFCGRVLALQSF